MNSPCLKLYQAYSISFNLSNVGIFLELHSKGQYKSSGKEKESCGLVFPSSTKHEIRHFQVVVMQQQLRNAQKSMMHVQSCCFVDLNLVFCRSCCHRRRGCLSSDTDVSNFLKAVFEQNLMGSRCSESVKSRVPSIGFL